MKKLLCILLAMLTMLSLLSIIAGAAGAQSAEVSCRVLLNTPIQTGKSDWSGRAFRVGPLVFATYFTPQTAYKLKVNGAAVNEDNALEIFVEGESDMGLMVIGTGLLVLYVPLKDVFGARGVKLTQKG